MLVPDVSAIVPLAFADEDSRYAEAVIEQLAVDGGIVPCIFWFEIWNVITINEQRRNRIAGDEVGLFLFALDRMQLETDPLPRFDHIIGEARTYDLTAYDAAYLELAKRTNSALATLDKALRQAARDAGVAVFAA